EEASSPHKSLSTAWLQVAELKGAAAVWLQSAILAFLCKAVKAEPCQRYQLGPEVTQ
ncbi:hypothetical protein NDU88_005214, partial [Pleurodeles waltl]